MCFMKAYSMHAHFYCIFICKISLWFVFYKTSMFCSTPSTSLVFCQPLWAWWLHIPHTHFLYFTCEVSLELTNKHFLDQWYLWLVKNMKNNRVRSEESMMPKLVDTGIKFNFEFCNESKVVFFCLVHCYFGWRFFLVH